MTVRDIAKLANVSPAAVSLAINNKPGISEKKRKEILAIIASSDFTMPHKTAADTSNNLVFLKLTKHSLLIEQNANFISKIMDSIQEKCKELGYTLQVDLIHEDFEKNISELNYANIDGIFVVGTEIGAEDYNALNAIKVPYIVIDNSMPNFPCNTITMSNEEMTYTAIEQLAHTGEKDIGHLRGNIYCQNFLERHIGMQNAIRDFHLEFSAKKEFLLTPTVMGSYEDMKAYLDKKTAVPRIMFADNDTIAIGAMKALTEYGYKIGQDISIIGFDDINLAETASPPLSTMQVQGSMIGTMATMTLVNEIKHKNPTYYKTKVGGKLILRTSTKGL